MIINPHNPGFAGAANLQANSVLENYDKYYTDEEPQKSENLLRRSLNLILALTSGAVGAGVLLYSFLHTPGTYKTLNGANRLLGRHPNPDPALVLNSSKNSINGMPIDSFVSNYKGFENIHNGSFQI